MRYCCMICGRPLDGTDWCCHECAEQYSLQGSTSNWPPWATELMRLEQAERRYQRKWAGKLVSLPDEWD